MQHTMKSGMCECVRLDKKRETIHGLRGPIKM